MSPLVGLIGKKRAGKDSFAWTLISECYFRRFAFADPLKAAALALNPVIGWNCGPVRLQEIFDRGGWEYAKEVPEVRRVLQDFGVGIREIDPDFWVRATLDRAIEHAHNSGPAVVTDVRFPNEADAIRAAGGRLIRILRPGTDDGDSHESEVALDDYEADDTVWNSRTLEDLAATARNMIFT